MADNNTPGNKGEESEELKPTGNQRIIVIGASAGGFEAIKKIVKELPADFNASVFIVWHISPDIRGIMPQVLNKLNTIYAAHAYDKEPIKPNRIYIASPDNHLLIEDGIMRVTHGPKENRFRPAIDPLFRSAAYTYESRVIGVILSGALDDGTAGLWAVKHYGGIAVVQDPADAEVPSMPESALRQVHTDYCVPVTAIADLLVRLSKEKLPENVVMKDEKTKKEILIAAEESTLDLGLLSLGELSPFACPECHGVLSKLKEGNISRYRCHTGHAYSGDVLMASITENIEDSLYSAIRGMDESIILLNHIGDHYAEVNQPKQAAEYFQKAKEAKERAEVIRKAAFSNHHVVKDAEETV